MKSLPNENSNKDKRRNLTFAILDSCHINHLENCILILLYIFLKIWRKMGQSTVLRIDCFSSGLLLRRRKGLESIKDVTIIQPRYAHIENLDCLVHSSNRVLWLTINQSTRLPEWARQSKFSMCAYRAWIMVTSLVMSCCTLICRMEQIKSLRRERHIWTPKAQNA